MSTGARVARSLFQRQLRGCFITLLSTVMVGGVLMCAGGAAALAPRGMQAPVGLAAFMLGLFTVLGGIVVWGVWNRWRLARRFDDAFLPVSGDAATSEGYLTAGRHIQGRGESRELDVWFARGTLEIYLSCDGRTRVGFARPGFLTAFAAGVTGRTAFPVAPLDVTVLAHEPDWARALTDDEAARAAIRTLMTPMDATELRSVSLLPDALVVTSQGTPLSAITASQARVWVTAMAALASAIEARAPNERLAASALETDARRSRRKIAGCAFAIVGVIMLGVLALSGAAIIGALLMQR